MAFGVLKDYAGLKRKILRETSETNILSYYLGITTFPKVINAPYRIDRHPSVSVYINKNGRVGFYDFAESIKGDLFTLLGLIWNLPYRMVLNRLEKDLNKIISKEIKVNIEIIRTSEGRVTYNEGTDLKCKIREWRDYDIRYWESFGITLNWLKYAEVYPISYKIIIKGDHKYVFGADKFAYAYVERKEGKVTLKIYQPFNKDGYKWSNKHDSSVISLWTKVPEYGEKICICSSLKDALCLWSNTGIPCIAVQGEGYTVSDSAISELRRRYDNIYILFDNDKAGLIDSKKLAESTGFTNLVLPKFNGGKDVSDLYKILKNKNEFKQKILKLFNHEE